MDRPEITAAMALAAIAGGAAGLRLEGIENLSATRILTTAPIIGIVKRDLAGSPVRITPTLEDINALANHGADIIAYDATARSRPVETPHLIAAIKSTGRLAMADCAIYADGERALAQGADILGTTLSGYAYEDAIPGAGPDFDLIERFSSLGLFVMAEGRFYSPQLAGEAMARGANCVTVGSAITRIEHNTGWFAASVSANSTL